MHENFRKKKEKKLRPSCMHVKQLSSWKAVEALPGVWRAMN